MKGRRLKRAVLLFGLWVMPGVADAWVGETEWAELSGQEVLLTSPAGKEIRGLLVSVDGETITVRKASGQEFEVPKAEVDSAELLLSGEVEAPPEQAEPEPEPEFDPAQVEAQREAARQAYARGDRDGAETARYERPFGPYAKGFAGGFCAWAPGCIGVAKGQGEAAVDVPAGEWQSELDDYQRGYAAGYVQTAQEVHRRQAATGGAIGAAGLTLILLALLAG